VKSNVIMLFTELSNLQKQEYEFGIHKFIVEFNQSPCVSISIINERLSPRITNFRHSQIRIFYTLYYIPYIFVNKPV